MRYGELVGDYDPIKEKIYQEFVVYFNNPVMSKIGEQNNFSIYAVKMQAFLGIEFRYIFAHVKKDTKKLETTELLSNLKWVSFQTRLTKEEYNTGLHSYIPRATEFMSMKIQLVQQTDQEYRYKVGNTKLKLSLLPKQVKKSFLEQSSVHEYLDTGTLYNALETYSTIVVM